MITFFTILTLTLLFLIISFNIFVLVSHGFIIGIYPYVAGLTLIFGLLLIIMRFVEGILLVKTIKGILVLLTVFMVFTFIQIWRNTKLFNEYQHDRSKYMEELIELAKGQKEIQYPLTRMEQGIVKLVEFNTGIPISYFNQGKLLNGGGATIDAMIEDIHKAESHIHVEFFIMRDDSIGNKFKDALIKKAKEGVKVRILYDGLGSKTITGKYVRELRDAGVAIEPYDGYIQSILKGKLNHRNHRKILVVDGMVGYVGGLNIGDEYLGRDENIGNWKDLQIRLEGDSVKWIQKIFLGDWYYVTSEKVLQAEYFPQHDISEVMPTQLITSGFDTHWNEMSQLYFTIITSAQEKVYIATPYLVLDDSMLKALQTAALRGVDVRVIIPKKPDLFILGWANESFFDRLLRANVKVYLYEDGFLHAKTFLIDDKTISIGSANLNTRSLFLDYEVNAIVYDDEIAEELLEEFRLYLSHSHEVTYVDRSKQNKYRKLREWIGKLIIPLA